MLSNRRLNTPDGRQLYQYRITDTEFSELEFSLRQYISTGQTRLNLSVLAKRIMFSFLFVLYGAEWWRRRYDGSGFTWEGIMRVVSARIPTGGIKHKEANA
jgi:hypothetical protein